MKSDLLSCLLFFLLLPGALGCGLAAQQQRGRDRPQALAPVEHVEIQLISGGHHWNATVIAHGHLPDACTQLGPVSRHRSGRDFEITITTTRAAVGDCAAEPYPYQKTLSLYLEPRDFGQYRAVVNGVAESFYVSSDPMAPQGVTGFGTAP